MKKARSFWQKSAHVGERHTRWAAQFAVASELCKMGYEVAFTLGHNTPLADLMCITPRTKQMFLVDVKGLSQSGQSWQIKKKDPRENLFYVLAHMPRGEPNSFFVMRQETINRLIDKEAKRLKSKTRGFRWRDGIENDEKWDVLPD